VIQEHQDIAYFSLEIGLEPAIPTYSGGLGILAGDTIRAAADLGLPYVGVTLLYRNGYFDQTFDADGRQQEGPRRWNPDEVLRELAPRVSLPIAGREVLLRAYQFDVIGVHGHRVPVYFLDSDLEENHPDDRRLTHQLYSGGHEHRIKQEAVLGIGGRRMVRAIGHDIGCFHMNEGHACLLCVELLSEYISRTGLGTLDRDMLERVRQRCVFTTHTPVPAGHDRFDIGQMKAIIGEHPLWQHPEIYGEPGAREGYNPAIFNTTRLALNLSKFANAVARKHGEVSRDMFPGYRIEAITNGVHAATWARKPLRDLFDRHCPEWRANNSDLRLAAGIPDEDVAAAHADAKRLMTGEVNKRLGLSGGEALNDRDFTIVFARRATAYKRPAMLLSDPDRLAAIAQKHGPIQVIYGGKAHPNDAAGKGIIHEIAQLRGRLNGSVKVVFVPNYEIDIAKLLVAGCDLWLNNPEPPLEASGTSGMKAALNGVPQLSTLDGWWLEGWVEGVTGWAIGEPGDSVLTMPAERLYKKHAESLYSQLDTKILPLYHNDRPGWIRVMKNAIALNGSHFTTERMVRDYALRAYGA